MNRVRQVSQRLRKTGTTLARDLRHPPWQPPGHYYSPVPSKEDVDRAVRNHRLPVGVDLHEDAQIRLMEKLNIEVPKQGRWTPENGMFGAADAALLQGMLRYFQPSRVTEVGSGYSTALMLDLAEAELPDLKITCIEPYADRLRSRLRPRDAERMTLVERQVQDIEPPDLAAQVATGDVFFIDSTHVLKAGSDVAHLMLHTLPLLPAGVLVHVHDIFWPFEYPDEWLRHGRQWTECYLLQAFLTHNTSWEILAFGSWLWKEHPELAPPGTETSKPGSIWLRRVD